MLMWSPISLTTLDLRRAGYLLSYARANPVICLNHHYKEIIMKLTAEMLRRIAKAT